MFGKVLLRVCPQGSLEGNRESGEYRGIKITEPPPRINSRAAFLLLQGWSREERFSRGIEIAKARAGALTGGALHVREIDTEAAQSQGDSRNKLWGVAPDKDERERKFLG